MAQSNIGKFDRMYQFLCEQNFEMNENVPSEYKCKKCNKLLINSYVGSCLCQFCCNCINEMLTKGLENCPGNKEECKDENLSSFVSDHFTNFKISKLVLKCPEALCLQESELVQMEEHLRVCPNRSVTCPFFGMGCNENKLVAYTVDEHLQAESYNHNKILIEMIETLRNELKRSDETNKKEIETLKKNTRIKDKTIAEIQEEIQRNKTQIEEILTENTRMKDETIAEIQQKLQRNNTKIEQILPENELKKSVETNKKEIETLKENTRIKDKTIEEMQAEIQNSKTKIEELLTENSRIKNETIAEMQQEIQRNKTQIEQISTENARMKEERIEEMQKQIKLIKMEMQQVTAAQINNLKVESNDKIANSTQQMKQEWRDNLEREVRQINDEMEKWQLQLTNRVNRVEKWQDRQMEASLTWKINEISDKRQNGTRIFSAIFYSKINSYKMQLAMINDEGSDEIKIYLYIRPGERDTYITWPYQGNVTINISNYAIPDRTKTIKKYCSISQPDINSPKCSDPFKLSHVELSTIGLIQDNYLIVDCIAE